MIFFIKIYSSRSNGSEEYGIFLTRIHDDTFKSVLSLIPTPGRGCKFTSYLSNGDEFFSWTGGQENKAVKWNARQGTDP